MKKITINLNIDDNCDITIKNGDTGGELVVCNDKKELNAKNIYELLKFEKGNTYSVKDDISKVEDNGQKAYYQEIIDFFKELANDLNELSKNIDSDVDGDNGDASTTDAVVDADATDATDDTSAT